MPDPQQEIDFAAAAEDEAVRRAALMAALRMSRLGTTARMLVVWVYRQGGGGLSAVSGSQAEIAEKLFLGTVEGAAVRMAGSRAAVAGLLSAAQAAGQGIYAVDWQGVYSLLGRPAPAWVSRQKNHPLLSQDGPPRAAAAQPCGCTTVQPHKCADFRTSVQDSAQPCREYGDALARPPIIKFDFLTLTDNVVVDDNVKEKIRARARAAGDALWGKGRPIPQEALLLVSQAAALAGSRFSEEWLLEGLTELHKRVRSNLPGFLRRVLENRLWESEGVCTQGEAHAVLCGSLAGVRTIAREIAAQMAADQGAAREAANCGPPARSWYEMTTADRADGHATAQAVLESLRNAKKLRDAN